MTEKDVKEVTEFLSNEERHKYKKLSYAEALELVKHQKTELKKRQSLNEHYTEKKGRRNH